MIDGRAITLDTLILPNLAEIISDEAEVLARQAREGLDNTASAAKTVELIKILEASEKSVKSLIFSQVGFFSSLPLSHKS